ncbi:MAG: acetylglutamate kinase [Candidatus Schekmanbacteria bacterium]|nr:MAG: acetylglutamate kinase [Candidatus Schekmanbacteria bacterium]
MEKYIEKANTLIEAIPYMREFSGETFVIKYGGSAMLNEELKENFALDVILLKYLGINPVIVHGGGPQIGEFLKKLGKESSFVSGHRVTDSETMTIVEMVLGGTINKEIVSLINRHGGRAIGLTGKDGNLLKAKKIMIHNSEILENNAEKVVDLGRVGEITNVYPDVILELDRRFIPVIAPIGVDKDGNSLNINADIAAGAIAGALKARKFVALTDTEGILDENGKLVSSANESKINDMVERGIIKGGMLPKVKCCLKAIKEGVKKVHIIDGRIKHALLLEIFTQKGIGTEIIAD